MKVYADFESLLVPIEEAETEEEQAIVIPDSDGEEPAPLVIAEDTDGEAAEARAAQQELIDQIRNPEQEATVPKTRSSTRLTHKHKCIAVSALMVSIIPELNNQRFYYCGEDCDSHFMEQLEEWESVVQRYIESPKPMDPLTPDEQQTFDSASVCYLCKKHIDPDETRQEWKKVRDHDHFTGKFLGAAHSKCNILRRRVFKVSFIQHRKHYMILNYNNRSQFSSTISGVMTRTLLPVHSATPVRNQSN